MIWAVSCRQAGGGLGQGAEDVVGDSGLVQAGAAVRGPVQAADGLGGGAGQGDGGVAGEVVQADHLPEVIHGSLLPPPAAAARRCPRWRAEGWRGRRS